MVIDLFILIVFNLGCDGRSIAKKLLKDTKGHNPIIVEKYGIQNTWEVFFSNISRSDTGPRLKIEEGRRKVKR